MVTNIWTKIGEMAEAYFLRCRWMEFLETEQIISLKSYFNLQLYFD
jgi:hypothetical protein